MLKFAIIFFSIIYLLGVLFKWFMRKWLKNISQQAQNNEQQMRKEGEVTIKQEANTKKRNAGEGEYVDFEEVK